MADIKHKLLIKVNPEKLYEAITTQEGIEAWWCKHTIAKPEVGFMNVFTFGAERNEFRVTKLTLNKQVEWKGIVSTPEWVGTRLVFDLEEKDGNTVLRFTHGDWEAITDMYAACNYGWGQYLKSLKSLCETGTGNPV